MSDDLALTGPAAGVVALVVAAARAAAAEADLLNRLDGVAGDEIGRAHV